MWILSISIFLNLWNACVGVINVEIRVVYLAFKNYNNTNEREG